MRNSSYTTARVQPVGLGRELVHERIHQLLERQPQPVPDFQHIVPVHRRLLADQRKWQWLQRAEREESDFLAIGNYQGESFDFHSLRHTCGSWLALQGVHPNVIKSVMRHSSITLTMDTYGHLLPDQHADAIGGMMKLLSENAPLAATGTVGKSPAVGSAVEVQNGAMECESVRTAGESSNRSQTLEFPRKSDAGKAKSRNGPTWIRTKNQGIMSPRSDGLNTDSNNSCDDTQSSDSSRRSNELDSDLERVLRAWPALPAALRAGILAMIEAARTSGNTQGGQ